MSENDTNHIRVVVRVRPPFKRGGVDAERAELAKIDADDCEIRMKNPTSKATYAFKFNDVGPFYRYPHQISCQGSFHKFPSLNNVTIRC